MIGKDWTELSRERALLFTSIGVPLLFVAVFLALAVLVPVDDPAARVMLLRPFVLMLLMIPEFSATAIAAHSIVGEKRAHTLEPVLATPITTGELMTAKCLVAGVPGIALTWLLYGLSAAALTGLTSPAVVAAVLGGPALLLMLLVAPLIAVLALGLAVIASARTSDPRSAQQIGLVVILPLIGLLVLQLEGVYRLSTGAILAWAGGLAVLDLLVLRAGVALFRRETILTRWR